MIASAAKTGGGEVGTVPATALVLVMLSLTTIASPIAVGDDECLTTSNQQCIFPFTYLGHTFNSCTRMNNGGSAWCATAVGGKDGRQYTGTWENCAGRCPVDTSIDDESGCMTTSRHTCVFPFKYKGFDYHSCTAIDNNGILWCATRVTPNGDYDGQWGNCGGDCRR